MNDGDALRRAIVAEPDDDTPRLIYADWLDENNQPARAAFIRLQIEAVRAEPFSRESRRAYDRAERILHSNFLTWSNPINSLGLKAQFERGFVGDVQSSAELFCEVASRVFALEPVQTIRIWRAAAIGSALLFDLLKVPELTHVRRFELRPRFDPSIDECNALGECPHLSSLTDLTLMNNPVPPIWLAKFLAGKSLPNLAGLNIADIPNLARGLIDGAARANHRRLKRLNISGVTLRWNDLYSLLQCPIMSELEELDIRNPLDSLKEDGPLSDLNMGWSLPWKTLRKLDVAGQGLGPAAVEEFVRQPDVANLRSLGLSRNKLGATGVQAIVESPHLHLNHLDVSDNGLSHDDIASLQSRFPHAVIESWPQ